MTTLDDSTRLKAPPVEDPPVGDPPVEGSAATDPDEANRVDGALPDVPEGPVAAAILAAGVGCATLGALTTAASASPALREWLQWNADVGPLSGKTGSAVIVWLVTWGALHLWLRAKAFATGWALLVGLVLIGVGVIGTFPPVFQAFAPE